MAGEAIRKHRRYLGSWTLPSGNSCGVYFGGDGLSCEWDVRPSPAWPEEDFAHWDNVRFPEIVRAAATVTGKRVVGITLL